MRFFPGNLIGLLSLLCLLAACTSDPGRLWDEPWPDEAASFSSLPLPTINSSEPPTTTATLAPETAALRQQGAQLYAINCTPCHQANGEGNLGRFPALNGNALVTGENPQPAIQVVLHGRNIMPGFADRLSAQEIAAILSYMRTAWSNNAAPVTAEQVAATATE